MTGFNHAAVGGILATALPLPLALPLAFVSHFVLDSLPHYGIPQSKRDISKVWKIIGVLDFFATFIIVGGLALLWQRYDILLCAIAAASPDFVWVARIVRTRSFDLSINQTRFTKWHAGIQHFERPWGIYLELPLAATLLYMLIQLQAAST